MATNYTTNYDLCQWEPTDAVQRVEFNQDSAKVDAALKSLSDQMIQKANQSAVNTLVTAVNQKANQTDLTAAVSRISALEGGKADQTALDQVETDLTAANRLVFLSQVTLGSSVSAYTLNLPDWSDAYELQIHYNVAGDGYIKFSFNDYAPCYDAQRLTTDTQFDIKFESKDLGAGVITLRPCGPSNLVTCFVSGLSLDTTGNFASYADALCSVKNVTVQTLTKMKFESSSGVIQSGSRLRLYKLL